jgi:Kef-type K+ transport system membrane component KefB
MTPFLQLAIELVLILLAAKAAGFLAGRLGQPAVLGELVAGLLLGPSLLDILHLPFVGSSSLGDTITELSELGVLFLMFFAGLELHLQELTRNRKVSFAASLGGLILSVSLGWVAGRLNGMSSTAALLLGIALGATSVSIAARTLMEAGRLRSPVGLSLLGAAVIDDILSILVFAIFMAVFNGNGSLPGLALITLRMILFLAGSVAFGHWVLPRLVRWVERTAISQGVLTLAIITMLVYGLAAELIGQMAAIIGAFIAGLAFARTPEKTHIESGINALAYGLFVPIFFINIGLAVNLRELPLQAIWLILAVTLVAIGGKLLGSALGARSTGLAWRQAWQLGAGMVARGEVTLIIAAVGKQAGLLDNRTFSALVAVVLITTLVKPPLMRAWLPGHEQDLGSGKTGHAQLPAKKGEL